MKKGFLLGLAGFISGVVVGGVLSFSFHNDMANAIAGIGRTDDFFSDEHSEDDEPFDEMFLDMDIICR